MKLREWDWQKYNGNIVKENRWTDTKRDKWTVYIVTRNIDYIRAEYAKDIIVFTLTHSELVYV